MKRDNLKFEVDSDENMDNPDEREERYITRVLAYIQPKIKT